MADEFPRTDPAAAPEAPSRTAPSRKGMLVVYHGEGAGKEAAGLGVLFRAHGRGLPARHVSFRPASDPPSSNDLALTRLGIPANHMAREDTAAAVELWEKAVRHISIVSDGALVMEGLLDAIDAGWLDISEVISTLSATDSLLHVIVTGRSAQREIVDAADLVSHMRAVKRRDPESPHIVGIDI